MIRQDVASQDIHGGDLVRLLEHYADDNHRVDLDGFNRHLADLDLSVDADDFVTLLEADRKHAYEMSSDRDGIFWAPSTSMLLELDATNTREPQTDDGLDRLAKSINQLVSSKPIEQALKIAKSLMLDNPQLSDHILELFDEAITDAMVKGSR